jgi:hypothetical protein
LLGKGTCRRCIVVHGCEPYTCHSDEHVLLQWHIYPTIVVSTEVHVVGYVIVGKQYCRRFETGGSLRPTSECRVPQPRWVERVGEREGGEGARRPETGVREVGIPRPSCSSRAQVGCACSRGLQASTREREASGPKRAPVPSSSPRGQPSLRGPWSFLL